MATETDDVVYRNDTLSALVADDSLELEQQVRIQILGKNVLLGSYFGELGFLLCNCLILFLGHFFDFFSLLCHHGFLHLESFLDILLEVLLGKKLLAVVLLSSLGLFDFLLKGLELSCLSDGLHHLLAGLALDSGLIDLVMEIQDVLLDLLAGLMQLEILDPCLLQKSFLDLEGLGDLLDFVLDLEHFSQNDLKFAQCAIDFLHRYSPVYSLDIILKLLGALGVSEPPERLGFDLSDPFTGHFKIQPNFFQCQ